MSFRQGSRVMTRLGAGTVAFVRLAPPDYTKAEAVSVVLVSRQADIGYSGTMFRSTEVQEYDVLEHGSCCFEGHQWTDWWADGTIRDCRICGDRERRQQST